MRWWSILCMQSAVVWGSARIEQISCLGMSRPLVFPFGFCHDILPVIKSRFEKTHYVYGRLQKWNSPYATQKIWSILTVILDSHRIARRYRPNFERDVAAQFFRDVFYASSLHQGQSPRPYHPWWSSCCSSCQGSHSRRPRYHSRDHTHHWPCLETRK